MSSFYQVFGLRVEATGPIEGLDAVTDTGDVDVRIRFDRWPFEQAVAAELIAAPFYTSHIQDARGQPFVLAWKLAGKRYLRLVMNGSTRVTLDRGSREVWIEAGDASPSLISEYVLGLVLSLVLRRRGVVCLHASVIAFDGVAVAFAGPEGAGKSTLAALFAMQGHPLITDDLAALVDRGTTLLVQPGARYLRIRPGLTEGHAAHLGCLDQLKTAPDGWHLDLVPPISEPQSASAPLRLGAVYCLDGLVEPAKGEAAIRYMNGAEAFMWLCADTWGGRLLDVEDRAREFDLLSRLVNGVPVRRVLRSNVDNLLDLAPRIRDDVRQITIPGGLHAH